MWLYLTILSVFLILLLSGMHPRTQEPFMSKTNTMSLRGLAILVVVIHHLGQRLDDSLPLMVYLLNFFIGYLAVGLFFFLSGYGNFIFISRNEKASTRDKFSWIVRRFIDLLVIFYVAEAMALVCEVLTRQDLKPNLWGLITFSLPNWDTWYIKIQLLLYVLMFIAWIPSKLTKIHRILLLTMLVSAAIIIMNVCGLSDYWWNTMLCFPAGALLAHYRSQAESWLRRYWLISGCVCTAVFGILFLLTYKGNTLIGIPTTVMFCGAILCWNFALHIQSPVLHWLGTLSFEIFLTHSFLLRTLVLLNPFNLPLTFAMLLLLIGTFTLAPVNKFIAARCKLAILSTKGPQHDA